MQESTTIVDEFSHAVINPRFQQLVADEESGNLSGQDLLDEISDFIEATKTVSCEGVAFVAQMNLLKNLHILYYEAHRRVVDVPRDMLHG